MLTYWWLTVSLSICLSAVLPLSSPSSSDEDSCVVKVRRWEQLLWSEGCFFFFFFFFSM